MKEQDYSTSFAVNNSPAEVFTAITNFRAWWSNQIEGSTDRLNELFLYHYKDVHLCKIKLIETVPDKKLVYQIVDNEFNFTKDKTEWINTELIFEISVEGGGRKNQSTVYA